MLPAASALHIPGAGAVSFGRGERAPAVKNELRWQAGCDCVATDAAADLRLPGEERDTRRPQCAARAEVVLFLSAAHWTTTVPAAAKTDRRPMRPRAACRLPTAITKIASVQASLQLTRCWSVVPGNGAASLTPYPASLAKYDHRSAIESHRSLFCSSLSACLRHRASWARHSCKLFTTPPP